MQAGGRKTRKLRNDYLNQIFHRQNAIRQTTKDNTFQLFHFSREKQKALFALMRSSILSAETVTCLVQTVTGAGRVCVCVCVRRLAGHSGQTLDWSAHRGRSKQAADQYVRLEVWRQHVRYAPTN